MRTAFIHTLIKLARSDKRIFLLVGDVGFSLVEPFVKEFPERFLNVGISEQNMMGIATGIALNGKVVFVYSLTNFPTLRCLEQIRDDVCYHNANVKIVAAACGFTYGELGATHHLTEDLSIMRSLPNIKVITPADSMETKLAIRALVKEKGPCYLRLQRTGEPIIHKTTPYFQIGKAITIHKGRNVAFIGSGTILHNAIMAEKQLILHGISVHIISMHTVKPIDKKAILLAAKKTGAIITIEENSILGGLGGAVAEVLAESKMPGIIFKRLGIEDRFFYQIGNQEYLRGVNSLSVESIVKETLELLNYRKNKHEI